MEKNKQENTSRNFTCSLVKRDDYLKNIMQKHPHWKIRRVVMWFLYGLSLTILLSFIELLLIKPMQDKMGIFIFLCTAVCFACVPFFFACSVKNMTKYKCALPYSGRINENLHLTDKELVYTYYEMDKTGRVHISPLEKDKKEHMFEYRINIDNVRGISIDDNHICYIDGKGTLVHPNPSGKNAKEKTVCKKFNFITDFMEFGNDNVEEAIRTWRKNRS